MSCRILHQSRVYDAVTVSSDPAIECRDKTGGGDHEITCALLVSSHQMAHSLMSRLYVAWAFSFLYLVWVKHGKWSFTEIVLWIGENGAKQWHALLERGCSMSVCVVIVPHCPRAAEHLYCHCQRTWAAWEASCVFWRVSFHSYRWQWWAWNTRTSTLT